ncbi:MAG: class I SAM-dependent methyltransferase [Solirubrobacteraceae bacterium MAG38_C4-C5]|nr:class I SAM-dependent methyltransferase [Candidatus Siliceabacter maunaloa]
MLASDVLAFVRAALPPRPARLLEVGAGDGELAELLRRDGYDVVAIDPASATPTVRAAALHELQEPSASFDAAVAVVSLHHVEPLGESCQRLGELVRAGGTLVVDEFDVERLDERAAHWLLAHRQPVGREHHAEPADFVADLRDHIHPLRLVLEALSEWFRLEEPVRGPHLHRWELPPGLQAAEEHLIAAGRLPAIGVRLVGTRR